MKQSATYYDLLDVSQYADLAEISAAFMRLSNDLTADNCPLEKTAAEFQLKLAKQAYEVLSSPSRRSDYDAGLASRGEVASRLDTPFQVEVLESKPNSPIRRLLTIIAAVLVMGMVMQVSVMFMAYQRNKAHSIDEVSSPASEKAYLQDFYQTYGIRAANRAEADLLLADMRRKEVAQREQSQQVRLQEEEERKQRRFEEESRRLGAEVTANNQRAEQEAARRQAEEIRQKEEKERQAKEAELARVNREINHFRGRSVSSGY